MINFRGLTRRHIFAAVLEAISVRGLCVACRDFRASLYVWKRGALILWYITVLLMERQKPQRFILLAVAVLYAVTGDYSLLHHLQVLIYKC